MIEIALTVLRYAWPWLLAAAVWGWQETRVVARDIQLAASHKRESEAVSKLTAAQQRATDLALLYAEQLPKIDAAARQQKEADDVRFKSLQERIDGLSRRPVCEFSPAAVRLWDDVSAAANGGNAGASTAPAGGTAAVPELAGAYSEADVVGYAAAAAAAYREAVRMFHEVREMYDAARAAQLKVNP